ncbi:MAG: two-component system cell cycle response regulator [Candidatus Paceibacteria bacterium]|jgi:two-component system cell cycle response regulator
MIHKTFEELRTSGQLPSPSGVGMQILQLTQGDDFSTEDIGQAISADSALTGRLLKLANSAESGALEPITTIGEATIRLGIRTVRNVALGLSLVSANREGACAEFDYDAYWSLSLARAVAGQQLSRAMRSGVPAEVYILGLLSDVGALALASVHPETYGEMLSDSEVQSGEQVNAREQELFQIEHSNVAGFLLNDWGLPDAFGDAVRSYETTHLAEGKGKLKGLTEMLKAADVLARIFLSDDSTSHGAWVTLSREFMGIQERSDFAEEEFHSICNSAAAEWREWGQILGIPTGSKIDFRDLASLVHDAKVREVERASPSAPKSSAKNRAKARGQAIAKATSELVQDGSMQILAVDDDPMCLKLLQRHLEKAGHRVTTAKDGEEALLLALETSPQIVVADWNMPGLDGIDLCRALRKIASGQRIYFLLLTGMEGEEGIVQAFDAGVDDYVVKPFKPRILLARIHAGRRIIKLQADLDSERQKQEKHMMELQVLTRKLRSAALTDPLTGLANRRFAMKRLAQAWESATRTDKPVSIIMMDIDYFKKVNDTYGHDAGDEVLRAVANVLQESSREEEDVCRIGGEEFVVICAGASAEEAGLAAERLRVAVSSKPVTWQGEEHHVTLSFGVASRTPRMPDFEDLVKAADEAVYSAKEGGRNRVVIAGEGQESIRKLA